mgnify:CR=1 FL=1
MLQTISAVTLVTRDMRAAVRFYESLGFKARKGASDAFTSFPVGQTWLNLIAITDNSTEPQLLWGRVVIHVDDVDAKFQQALSAGGKETKPLEDQFYGDQSGTFKDLFGHQWTMATHIEDVSNDEIQRRLK